MFRILTAADLIEDAKTDTQEVSDAFILLQEGVSPTDIIHYLRGEDVQLLDPERFASEVQERFEQIQQQKAREKAAGTQHLPLSSLHGGPPPQDHFPARQ
jgi:hypothetical protein